MNHIIHTYYFWLLALVALTVQSCTEREEWQPQEAGKEIRLFAYKPDDSPSTKAPDKVKEEFISGDIIHVMGEFTAAQSGITIPTQYACMKFDGSNWKTVEGSPLVWPWNAATGTFTGYYIPGTTNALTTDDRSLDLSELSKSVIIDGKDPLKATYTNIAVGSAVHLQFNHICTKFTFTSIEDFVMPNQKIQIEREGITNKMTFTLKDDKHLSMKFADTDSTIEGVVESVNGKKTLTFLLPPLPEEAGKKVRMLHPDNSVYHSFELPQALEAGKHYILDITKLADNYIDESLKEADWNSSAAPVILDTDGINAYLEAIRDGDPYTLDDGTKILIQIQEGDKQVVAQIKDVDFDNQSFTPVNISENIIFQGNNHRIKNINLTNMINENVTKLVTAPTDGDICLALFGRNQGVLKNIILEGVKTDKTSTAEKLSYVSAFVGKNINGTIENVKIRANSADNKLTVSSESEKLYMGTLVGYSTGTISKCMITGDITLSGTSTASAPTSKIMMGGLAGEVAGAVSNCKVMLGSSTSITAKNTNKILLGGFVGVNTDNGIIERCISNATVKADGGDATTSAIGGFIGQAEKDMTNCAASGDVTAAGVPAGGFTGKAISCKMNICSSTGTITGTGTTGGFVGILTDDTNGSTTGVEIKNSFTISAGTSLTNGFIGNISAGNANHLLINSFSNNNAINIAPSNQLTVTNSHHKGSSAVDVLNNGCDGHTDWLRWTVTPAIYGEDIPYHIR